MFTLQSKQMIILISLIISLNFQKTGIFLERKPDSDFKQFLSQGISTSVCEIKIYKGDIDLQKKVDEDEVSQKIVQLEIKKDNSADTEENNNLEMQQKIDDLKKGQISVEEKVSTSKIIKDQNGTISLLLSCTVPNSKNLENKKIFGKCQNVHKIDFKNNESNFIGKKNDEFDLKEFIENEQESEKTFFYLEKMGKSDENEVKVLNVEGQCQIYFNGKAFVKVMSLFFGFFVLAFY